MPQPPKLNLSQHLRSHNRETATAHHPEPARPYPPASGIRISDSADIQSRLRQLAETEPLELMIDDPVFNTEDAARILGLKASRLEKWRQRGQGPDYLFYDKDGVRYELSALVKFKASRRVRPTRQPHPGKRY